MSTLKTWVCKRCGFNHPLNYLLYGNGTRHLAYRCTKTHETFLLHYIAGLDIPEVETKAFREQRKDASQGKLAL